jgi:hypothetical protein
MYEDEDPVEKALGVLTEALRTELIEEGKITVSLKEHQKLQEDYVELFDQKRDLSKNYDELYRRNNGMMNHLQRIRTKADMATGYNNVSGSCEEAADAGRGAGAEGAVDRLIAMHAGNILEIQRLKGLLKAAKVPEWVIEGREEDNDPGRS